MVPEKRFDLGHESVVLEANSQFPRGGGCNALIMSIPLEDQKEISCRAPPSIGIKMKRNLMKTQSKSRTLVVFTVFAFHAAA
jgi:hypothetical protein